MNYLQNIATLYQLAPYPAVCPKPKSPLPNNA